MAAEKKKTNCYAVNSFIPKKNEPCDLKILGVSYYGYLLVLQTSFYSLV